MPHHPQIQALKYGRGGRARALRVRHMPNARRNGHRYVQTRRRGKRRACPGFQFDGSSWIRYESTSPCWFGQPPAPATPPHRHYDIEECFVLDGDLRLDDSVLHAGDYQRAEAGSVHGVQWTEGGCTLLIISSTQDELLKP